MSLSHLQSIKLVIFDFDGTIADTSEGIIDSHKYTLCTMGRSIPTTDYLRSLIGGNLYNTYLNEFAFEEKDAKEAVRIYRNYYAKVGIHKAKLYDGFADLLLNLKERDILTGVATLKADSFARIMLHEMRIDQYFDVVCGMDANDCLKKSDLILECLRKTGIEQKNAVLVGDSINDMIGAQDVGIRFIGALYGFGFNKNEKCDFPSINNPLEIEEMIE